EKPVRYYVMGANEWREGQSWPPAAKNTPYYLKSADKSGESPAGSLSAEAPGQSKIAFVSDPENPVVNKYANSGGHDYRELANRNDMVTFDSAPLEHDTEVTGPITADMFVSCDCRDFDLWVRLLDVA